ncbi:polyphosphate kinase 2 family protein [Agrococcus casei]|uniref:UDP-galactose-lipid carrier transferase n=1 Tax=Agrococcus casei LMG 22410 TaxID=1255656 RepID=A0A1R4G9S4_9MICO|nr:polyphosphate kinase 2 family protein [Agrococcus casei]SJM64934.1 UDP-galactose-lipid carrier transferase [Agrococcus casei LMG 22410]
MSDIADALRVTDPNFDLSSIDPQSTPAYDGKKADGEDDLADGADHLSELQERLFASSKAGSTRSVLLMIQGMDTAGKGGIVRHVVGQVDPQGVQITGFKAPTDEEKQHDFLWRIRKAVPEPGMIGVFDRSQYEDVLIHRVHGWADEEELERRYAAIADFEKELHESGTVLIKVMLHISREEQGERLLERLDRPDKHWKFNPGDIDEREHWDAYQHAYQLAIQKTTTDASPWHVVPANRKWFARLAVQHLLTDALESISPEWPKADFNVKSERERLIATGDVPEAE